MGTAYLALICCIAKSIIDHKRTAKVEIRSSLDRWVFALGEIIVILSDQQVITGISILVGGFSQLQSGITIYH
jgi:formate/nitrite transporter FocA (FNT family)